MDRTGLTYNTEKEQIVISEYGRCVQEMIKKLHEIEDREQRTEAAKYIISVMVQMNPSIKQSSDYEHKLWDHLYMIAGYDLDVDAPYPFPVEETFTTDPVPIPMKGSRIKAFHYGRNIESIINLLCEQPDGEVKTEMIRSLAIYMRQQYLIWNKDSVADETIFADIEKLSDYRLRVPEGISLSKIAGDANFARPGMGINVGQPGSRNRQRGKNYKRPFKKK
jgi:hypothetical protein